MDNKWIFLWFNWVALCTSLVFFVVVGGGGDWGFFYLFGFGFLWSSTVIIGTQCQKHLNQDIIELFQFQEGEGSILQALYLLWKLDFNKLRNKHACERNRYSN